jgi:hypothetical protein
MRQLGASRIVAGNRAGGQATTGPNRVVDRRIKAVVGLVVIGNGSHGGGVNDIP